MNLPSLFSTEASSKMPEENTSSLVLSTWNEEDYYVLHVDSIETVSWLVLLLLILAHATHTYTCDNKEQTCHNAFHCRRDSGF